MSDGSKRYCTALSNCKSHLELTNDNKNNIWEMKRIPAERLIPSLGPLVDANTDI